MNKTIQQQSIRIKYLEHENDRLVKENKELKEIIARLDEDKNSIRKELSEILSEIKNAKIERNRNRENIEDNEGTIKDVMSNIGELKKMIKKDSDA